METSKAIIIVAGQRMRQSLCLCWPSRKGFKQWMEFYRANTIHSTATLGINTFLMGKISHEWLEYSLLLIYSFGGFLSRNLLEVARN